MKAAGFNAVSLYFDWDYHSPRPGVYDFTGVRDVDKLLDMAQQAGLYVIVRPAPVHQRRGRQRRAARLADHQGREQPQRRPALPAATRISG